MLENDIKKYLREVEKVLDNHHKSFPIFSNKRELVLLQVLRIFEDLTRLRGFFDRKPILLGQREIEIHNLLDSLAMAIQWIFEECDVCTKPPSLEMDNDLYVEALSLLMSAGDYRTVCDGYTMWSRGRHISEINEKEKRIKFVPRSDMNLAYEAADTVLETRRKIEPIKSIKFNKCFLSIMAVSDQLVKTVKQINGYIVYEIPGDVWGAFKDFSQLMIEESFELPPDWDFGVFSLREFSSFWQALHAKCMIHAWACLKSGVVGAGIESVVMIKTPDELASEISHLGQITPEKSRAITDYLTFIYQKQRCDIPTFHPIFRR